MKKNLLPLILLPLMVMGQERKLIKGQLIYRNRNVVAANVVNNTAQLNTITDGEGGFEIPVASKFVVDNILAMWVGLGSVACITSDSILNVHCIE